MSAEEAAALAERAANAAAEKAVREIFAKLGIDIADIDDVRRYQADQAFVSRLRRLSEKVGAAVLASIAASITGGIFYLLAQGFKGVSKGG